MEGSVIRRCPFHDRGNMKAQRKEESAATAKPRLWTRGFILLALIGGNMIRESLSKDEEAEREERLTVDHKELLMLAVATSIDALAVGVSFSMVEISISIGAAVILIGCTTFVISLAGVFIGNAFGAKYEKRAEFVGGAILILIGLKILLEHFGVL